MLRGSGKMSVNPCMKMKGPEKISDDLSCQIICGRIIYVPLYIHSRIKISGKIVKIKKALSLDRKLFLCSFHNTGGAVCNDIMFYVF